MIYQLNYTDSLNQVWLYAVLAKSMYENETEDTDTINNIFIGCYSYERITDTLSLALTPEFVLSEYKKFLNFHNNPIIISNTINGDVYQNWLNDFIYSINSIKRDILYRKNKN